VRRSNHPLALSVVTLTVPGNVDATVAKITEFDDADFGFNHNQTWAAMPAALRGELKSTAVATSFSRTPIRVQQCIVALCELGEIYPKATLKFADFPASGLKSVEVIDWDPEVGVRVRASCWYVERGRTIIPILQPRKQGLEGERLAIYVRLAEQAYRQGDWIDAVIELIDLSGEGTVSAHIVDRSTLPAVSDARLTEYVQTFVQAKRVADAQRRLREKAPVKLPLAELLGLDD